MQSSGPKDLVIAGDVGGTKTYLALFGPARDRPVPLVIENYSSRDAGTLEELIDAFLAGRGESVKSACFGIAGPVSQGSVKTTNLPWVVSENALRERFNWKNVRLINDLSATALSIAALDESEVAELHPGRPEPGGVIGVVAPGTGLGMALLVFVNGIAHPVESEGGHVDFAPRSAIEIALLQDLFESHVSVERLASGPGLFTIYSLLKKYRGHTEPSWLTERFRLEDASRVVSEVALKEKESLCVESLEIFVSILGAAAGNLALTGMTTGGIYLAGGICPKIMPKLREGGFMKAFTDKGRFREFVSGIPVRVILNEKAALLGAACCALDL
jgi:glucokinase